MLLAFLPEGMPIKIFGRVPNISFFDLAIVLLLPYLFAENLVGRFSFSLQDRTLNILMSLYVLANLLSFLSSLFSLGDPQRSFLAIKVIIFGYLIYLIAISSAFSRQAIGKITNGLVVFSCLTSLLLIYSFITQWSSLLNNQIGQSVVKGDIEISAGASNYVAALLLPVIPLAFAKLFSAGRKQIVLWLPASVLILAGMLITLSKGAILSLIAGTIVALFFLKSKAIWFRTILGIAAVSLLIFLLLPATLLGTYSVVFLALLQHGDPSRITIWQTAWTEFLRHPLLGVGPGCIYIYISQAGEKYLYVHNYVLNALADLGLAGAVPFLAMLWVASRRALRLPSLFPSGSRERAIAIGLVAGIAATLTHGLVEPTFAAQEYSVVFWVLMALVFLYGRYYSYPESDPQRSTLLGSRTPGNAQTAIPGSAALMHRHNPGGM